MLLLEFGLLQVGAGLFALCGNNTAFIVRAALLHGGRLFEVDCPGVRNLGSYRAGCRMPSCQVVCHQSSRCHKTNLSSQSVSTPCQKPSRRSSQSFISSRKIIFTMNRAKHSITSSDESDSASSAGKQENTMFSFHNKLTQFKGKIPPSASVLVAAPYQDYSKLEPLIPKGAVMASGGMNKEPTFPVKLQ